MTSRPHGRSPEATVQRHFPIAARRAGVFFLSFTMTVLGLSVLSMPAANAVTLNSATFSGGANTVSVGGTLYAKTAASLTLTASTTSDAQCVQVSGTHTARQTNASGQTSWTFPFNAVAGDGAHGVTVVASEKFNANNCTGQSTSTTASYTVDNTGPVVTAAVAPAPNGAGWNKTGVTVNWTATDTGSGVSGTQPFKTETVNANGITNLTAPAQSDRLGNLGAAGSVTVRVDKATPTITATQTDNPDGTTTVTFTCSDTHSGIASCVADGTSPASNSRTVTGPATVTGTATDVAGNTVTTSVTVAARDTTAPTITHTVSPAPNAAGWNKADATVTFNCSDSASGVKSCVADGTSPASASKTITAETNGTLVSGTATDNANNTATDAVTVKIDKTVPTISASRSPAANADGWNNTDVTVSFTCNDLGAVASGVKTCPAPVVLSAEGSNLSASGTAADNADNNSAAASITGVKIDKTAPVLNGNFSSGWHTGDVTVSWTCTDALSGPAAQPADTVATGEGSNLSATATCTDKAGNSTTTTVNGIQIDRHAPTTGISGTSNDWVSGDVTVSFSATDNLSGVASTSFSVDGGGFQSGTSVLLSTEGDHTIVFYSTDNAGNVEDPQTVHVKIDKTAPTIGHVFTPSTYADGAWTNQSVTVTFECADQGGSGVASCADPVTRSAEGEAQHVTGTATDSAGNSATDTAIVSIDKTPPTVAASSDRPANGAGWYDDDVTVTFDCDDALSGVATCPDPTVLGEGANQSASGSATDNAGNSASDGVSGVDVDKTAPVLNGSFLPGWHTDDVTVNWTCTDALSGPAGQPADSIVSGEGANLSATATCYDKAGNSTTKTVSGIQIDRTAPATGVSVSGTLHGGWYQAGVDVDLTATDNLSGVDKTYYSLDGGAAQLYSAAVPVAADGTHTLTYWSTDKAGNVEDETGNSVTLKIDKTPPTLNGVATTAPNGNGWYSDDVTVHWTCSDATSGIDGACPDDSVVGGEGDDLSASASVSDVAGNSTSKTVSGIQIDRTPPVTLGSVPAANGNGWYKSAVQVTLNADDNLSGVTATKFAVDGGAAQSYSGPFSFGAEGVHEIEFWSVDAAGNIEAAGAPITLHIDKTAPVTTVINPISPDSGWFVESGIPFAFDAKDVDGSGIDATYYTIDGGSAQTYGDPFTQNLSTGVHNVTYWSVDLAGNEEAHATTNTIEVKVDTIAPDVTATRSPAANAFGWNNTSVDVKFACTDADSGIDGIAGCGPDQTVAAEGAGQQVTGYTQDVAGNDNSTVVDDINIDKTKPSLVGTPTTDANAAGWYKGDATIAWTGTDGLSGIDPSTAPANSVITGEGSNLGASASVSDKAGNSTTASVAGIKIDRTAPVISGGPTTSPNGAGWYRDSVTVDFTCTDNLSGVAECPTSKVVSGDGANQSVTSDPASDKAGNEASGKTVGGINIDGSAPSTTANNQCTKVNGWCTGSTASVVLTATDQAGLSGVKAIHYKIDGGAEQVAAGATKTVSVPLDGSGAGKVAYWAVDNAGNAEAANEVSLKWDNIAPTVTHTLSPPANANDWNKSDVTVHFTAKDDDAGSGVASVTPDQVISSETSGLLVTGTATDTAGNAGTDSVTVRLDKTAPIITGAVVGGTLGNNGWYVGPVKIHFTCSDALSGVATCPDDVTLTGNGANQSATGTVTDKAGNSASATVSGISIDKEPPTITNVNVDNGDYTLGAVPAATCTAADSYSGLVSCNVVVTGGSASGVGTFNYTATATDKAGNKSTQTGSYKVRYAFDGFLQPINDTAHQVGLATSVFKAGSTVPVKFQLKNSSGQVVQAATAPVWLTPVKGGAMSMPIDETVQTVTADSGTTFRYDATAQQYIYNWKTPTPGGSYYQIGVKLADGQVYYVNIGLR
jgi:hypothetical protein